LELPVAAQIAERISEHAKRHDLEEVHLVLHGGEPLLAGAERIDRLVVLLRERISARISFGLQTNGTLISPEILDVFAKHKIPIGMSLDGDRLMNNRHRLTHSGASSFDDVSKAIALIRSRDEWSGLLGGFLAVIDPKNDPVEVFSFFKSINARSIDLLLPDFNHDRPPPRSFDGYESETAYGEWLARFFDAWFDEGSSMEIKYFEEIITLMLGGPSGTEAIGLTPVDLIVIETNGDIEPVDTLKTASRSATALGMNVSTHSFDDASQHPAVWSRMLGARSLCETCRDCTDLANCGGGYIPHRFKESNGFLNTSIYCADLKHLFSRIRSKLGGDKSQSALSRHASRR
jgi:uncharacterized protein